MAATTDSSSKQHDVVVVDDVARRSSVGGERSTEEIVEKGSPSPGSEQSVDLECGGEVGKAVQLARVERDCRICHMSMDAGNHETGIPMELGCSCKGDLAAAHKHCAETWFKIKGDKTCEICGSTAQNVNGGEAIEQWSDSNETVAVGPTPAEPSHFWKGHRFLNFLLACTVFAFVISWLFHFNVPS